MTTPTQADGGLGGAARGTAYNVIGALLTTASGFGSVWLVSREFGRSGTGALFTAVGLFTVLAGASKLGSESSTTWYIATARSAQHTAAIPDVVRSALRSVALVALALGLIVAACSSPLADLLVDEPDLEDDFQRMLVVLGLAIPAWAVAQASYGVSRGYGTMRVSVIAGSIVRPAVLLAVLAVLTWTVDDLWVLAFAWAAAGLAALTVSIGWIRARLSSDTTRHREERERFWRYTRPRAGSDVLHAVLDRSDLLLLSAIAGTAAAGDYAAASRLVLMGQLFLVAIAQALAPFVGRHLAQDAVGEAQRLIQTLTTWSVLATWPAMIVLAVNAEAVTDLFGDDFAEAAPLVRIMAIGLAAMASLGPGDTILLMTGDSRGSLWNHVIALVTMVGVSLALIPFLDAVGAALAWAASRGIMRILSVWRIQRSTGVRCVNAAVGTAALVSLMCYLPIGVALTLWGGTGIETAILNSVIGTALFIVVVRSRRTELSIDELIALRARRP